MSHLLVMCHSFLDGSPGWEPWAEWQSRSSVLSVPSPRTRQGLAELLGGLGAQSWGGGQGPHGSTFLFTQLKGVRQHLGFSLGNVVCSRPVSQARKKYFCLKKKKEKVVIFKSPLLIYWHFRERWDVMCLTSRYWAGGGSPQVFNSVPEVGISYPFRAPNPYL